MRFMHLTDLFQHHPEPIEKPRDFRRLEYAAAVLAREGELFTLEDFHHQRVMREIEVLQFSDPDAQAVLRAQRSIDGIILEDEKVFEKSRAGRHLAPLLHLHQRTPLILPRLDRKSTRLNSSHTVISYAVFCLKKKKYAYKKRTI